MSTLGKIPGVASQPQQIAVINNNFQRLQAESITKLYKDSNGIPSIIEGILPDGTTGFKVAKPGVNVTTATDDQLIFNSNQNIFKIAAVIPYVYIVTTTDLSNNYINLTVAHGLGFAPTVDASFSNTSDGLRRPIPFNLRPDTTTYFGSGINDKPNASVEINKIDNNNIYVQIKINDALGLSYFLTNTTLTFKFYCRQETIAA